MERTGQSLVDIREATVKILSDRPELVMTYARLETEGGPPLHVHEVQADTFVVLGGELTAGLGDEEHAFGAGMAWSAPPGVVHGYRHEGTDEVVFLNLHTPGMDFAEYLFGEKSAEQVDQYPPPADGGLPVEGATVLRFAEQGETITQTKERDVRILVDSPELVMTWTRYDPGEEGPGPHVHHEHIDAFFILSGELAFRAGPDLAPITATPGTFVLAPPDVVHTFKNEGAGPATWLNFHAPSAGFAEFLRDTSRSWDSFPAPADGGRPASEMIVEHVHPA